MSTSPVVGVVPAYARYVWDVLGARVLAALALVIAAGVVEGANLLVLVTLLRLVGVDLGGGTTDAFATRVAQTFTAVGVAPTLPTVLAFFVALSTAQALLLASQSLLNLHIEQRLTAHLRHELYSAIVHANWTFLSRERGAALSYALTTAVDRVGSATGQSLAIIAASVHVLIGVLIAVRVSLPLTAAACISGVAIVLALRGRTRRSRLLGEAFTGESERFYGLMTESLGSLRTAKAHGGESRTVALFDEAQAATLETWRTAVANYVQSKLRMDVASSVLVAALVFASIALVPLPTGGLLLLLLIFARIVPRVTGLQFSLQLLLHVLPSFDSVTAITARCRAAAETAPGSTAGPGLTRAIAFAGVRFRYEDDRPDVLEDVTLVVPAGRLTALVGPSGAGKTTIADLAMGLLSPTGGVVYVDDTPLEPAGSWRSHVGYVSQDPFLFHDTIRANLLWAEPAATDDDIRTALATTGADLFIARLPRGIDTVVGDRGVLLSGGERQRIALARALLRRPDVLIVDEPTSALDSESELRIVKALARLRNTVTVLLVTHRTSAVRWADIIYVIEEGRVVEQGSWDRLIASENGHLRRMAELQGVVDSGRQLERPVAVPFLR